MAVPYDSPIVLDFTRSFLQPLPVAVSWLLGTCSMVDEVVPNLHAFAVVVDPGQKRLDPRIQTDDSAVHVAVVWPNELRRACAPEIVAEHDLHSPGHLDRTFTADRHVLEPKDR